MFTVPVGCMNVVTLTSRPTSNTVTSGSVTNPANCYDGSPSTYAEMNGAAGFYVANIAGGVISSPITISVTVYNNIASGGPGSGTSTAVISVDGGGTFPYSLWSISGVTDASATYSVTLPSLTNLSSIWVKFATSTSGGWTVITDIYDVKATY